MKRKITKQLKSWKENANGDYALLIEGARRVGKSYIVEAFAKQAYRSYILIDFNIAPKEVRSLFLDTLHDLDTFFLRLSAMYGTKLYPRESLIILDEVQLFPKARSAVKYLVADHRYDYLETGSLISIQKNVQDIVIPSEERSLEMYPMDFEEFLWALDQEPVWELICSAHDALDPLSDGLHRKTMELFRQYLLVGGMPQAVHEYIDTKDFERVDAVKRAILHLYRQDMQKYGSSGGHIAERIFDSLPAQLQRPRKKFSPSLVYKNARTRSLQSGLAWLFDSMIATPCYSTEDPMIGYRLNMDDTQFKCYLGDTGLLISHAFDESRSLGSGFYGKMLLGKLEVDEGMIAENAVAQMLTASGHRLYYYASSGAGDAQSRMEVDFLVTDRNLTNGHNVCPIEVKSGNRRVTKSLDKFQRKFDRQSGTAYVVSDRSLLHEGKRIFLPFYMVPLL